KVVMGVHLAFPIMFLKRYLDGIPRDMEEAAQVDGCNQLQALVRIVLPTATPAIFTTFALVFVTSWQTSLNPLVLSISDETAAVRFLHPLAYGDGGVDPRFHSAGCRISHRPATTDRGTDGGRGQVSRAREENIRTQILTQGGNEMPNRFMRSTAIRTLLASAL